MAVHTVAKGETLGAIAQHYGVTARAVQMANPGIKDADKIQVGMKLQVPSTEGKSSKAGVATSGSSEAASVGAKNTKSAVTEDEDKQGLLYTVKPGDTLSRIAENNGVTVKDLMLANPSVKDPTKLYPGQKLLIPKRSGKLSGNAPAAAPKAAPAPVVKPAPAAAPKAAPVAAPAPSAKPATGGDKTGKKRNPPNQLSISDRGVEFIASFEGFEANLYNDAANHCTIGYGHLVHYGPCTDLDKKTYPKGVNKSEALALLRKDAGNAIKSIQSSVKVDLAQEEFDALVSWVFNLGGGSLKASTMLKKLNNGEYEEVPKEMNKWTKAGGKELKGLVKRRKAEGDLFANGTYASN